MPSDLSKPATTGAVRTFLAVPLPEAEKDRLAAVQRDLAAWKSLIKVVSPGLLHITVRFLGNIEESRLQGVKSAAAEGAGRSGPFTLHLAGLGAFPSLTSPRVLWAGLAPGAGLDALRRLHATLETALATVGFPREERRFAPHITLARTRDDLATDQRRRLGAELQHVRERHPLDDSFPVGELIVMRSDLRRAGPVYTPLDVFPLTESRQTAGSEP
jgi:2'-5' RNA ligase